MRGFLFRICVFCLCITVLFCACQKSPEEPTTTTALPETTVTEPFSDPETTATTTETTTQETTETTTKTAKKNNSKVTTTKAAVKPTAKPEKPAEQAPAKDTVEGAQTGFESDMLKAVNAQRKKNGLSELTLNQSLCASARVRAEEISKNGCFSHTRPDGSDCFTALSGISYSTAGENIAMGTWGYFGVDEIMNGWMNSEGHRANILNGAFTSVGFGCVVVNGNGYWVQMFIG